MPTANLTLAMVAVETVYQLSDDEIDAASLSWDGSSTRSGLLQLPRPGGRE